MKKKDYYNIIEPIPDMIEKFLTFAQKFMIFVLKLARKQLHPNEKVVGELRVGSDLDLFKGYTHSRK